jgi:HSP20 family protein
MANALTRWDPWQEMAEMRRAADRMFGDRFGRLFDQTGYEDAGQFSVGVDVSESPDRFVVRAAIPGVKPEDVDINVENDILTVKGKHREEQETREGETYLRRELRWGSFERSLRLPPTVDADKAEANFEHGILTIALPKKPESQPKKISITAHPMIEGEQKRDGANA